MLMPRWQNKDATFAANAHNWVVYLPKVTLVNIPLYAIGVLPCLVQLAG